MTEPQPALNVIHGWPDDQRVLGSISETGAYVITRFGTPSLLDHIPRRNTVDIWLGPGTPSQSAFTARPTLNYIADPDLCSRALAAAVRLSETVSVPWLNHPRSVLNNTRDKLALALAGIPGIVVPRTLRLAAPGLAAIKKAVQADGLRYPVIVRIAGLQDGAGTVLVRTPNDYDRLHAIPWGGRDLYVSEFINTRSADGRYRKHRIVVIGGRPLIRHVATSEHWLVNTANRMLTPPALAEEALAMERFTARIDEVAARVTAMAERLSLDYFGIDCCLTPDGAMIVFEANAAMQTTSNVLGGAIWDEPVQRIKQAVVTLLDHPERWIFGPDTAGGAPTPPHRA